MDSEELRVSEYLRVERGDENQFILKARDEVGRGKRFGMSGEISMDEREAEKLAQWIFASQFVTAPSDES